MPCPLYGPHVRSPGAVDETGYTQARRVYTEYQLA